MSNVLGDKCMDPIFEICKAGALQYVNEELNIVDVEDTFLSIAGGYE